MEAEVSLDRCEEILTTLLDTFGEDDMKYSYAFGRYQMIINEGSDLSIQLARTYLEWCLAKPARIGKLLDIDRRNCKCHAGWILEDEKLETYRPCPRCLPGAHDLWMTGFVDDPYSSNDDGEIGYPIGDDFEQTGF